MASYSNRNIISLKETESNTWVAKYLGNYGKYTIEVKMDGDEAGEFECNCPSDYYPCKHIAIIEEAINEVRLSEVLAQGRNTIDIVPDNQEISLLQMMDKVTLEELRKFVIVHARIDSAFEAKLKRHFFQPSTTAGGYAALIRSELANFTIDFDDYYDSEETIEVDILDEWLEKASKALANGNTNEAIDIAKAIIEEYPTWLEEQDSEVEDYLGDEYEVAPFNILTQAVALEKEPGKISDELFEFATNELPESKYSYVTVDLFHDLLLTTAHTREQFQSFIVLQNGCLEVLDKEGDKGEREDIIRRKLALYMKSGDTDKEWDLLNQYIEIEDFRKLVVERHIADKKYGLARFLVKECLADNQAYWGSAKYWQEQLLKIAMLDNDINGRRESALALISSSFNEEHFNCYKETFSPVEWPKEREKLIAMYVEKNRGFNSNIAALYIAEADMAGLKDMLEKKGDVHDWLKYYRYLEDTYAPEVLIYFRNMLDSYATKNTGRSHYEFIVSVLYKMKALNGGLAVVRDMKHRYLTKFKNRPALCELLKEMEC